jgi:hypothetical protein
LDSRASKARLTYQPASRGTEVRVSSRRFMLAMAGAPIFGSRFVFPRRFDRAVARLLANPEAVGISPVHAARFFGSTLHLEVDPTRLTERLSDYVVEPRGAKWMGVSFLDAADWDAVIAPIDHSPIHREMSELVAAGADYRDTRAYRNLVYAIEVGRPSRRNGVMITTVAEIEAYIGYCRDLIKSARKRGVVRHRVSGAFHRLRVKHRDARSIKLDSRERDIGVAITADGRIVRHLGGKHRTAIAQALKLPWMPVEVRLVHVRWIASEMKRTGLPAHSALLQGVSELKASISGRD